MHLYFKDGKPCYEVPYADPKKGMRKSTLKDARRLGLVPSVTTIFDVMNKQGLNIWLQDRLLESALTLSRNKNEPDKAFFARIKQDSKEISLLARNEGTRIHDALEHAFKGRTVDRRYVSLTNRVKDDVYEYFGTSDGWNVEEPFAHSMGYGGKVDLNNRNIKVVLDFKTKEEFKYDKKDRIVKMAYDEQAMQLAAYSIGLRIENARHINLFIDYDGNTVFHEWDAIEIGRAWKMFRACVELWVLQKNYDPKY